MDGKLFIWKKNIWKMFSLLSEIEISQFKLTGVLVDFYVQNMNVASTDEFVSLCHSISLYSRLYGYIDEVQNKKTPAFVL